MSLLALVAGVALVAFQWNQLPVRVPRFGLNPGVWTARNALRMVSLMNVAAYLGLTAATQWRKLIQVPEELDRDHPHVRQLLFSMVIVLKTVLMLFSLYLVWALLRVAQGEPSGIGSKSLTLFVLCVPLPLIWYTVKLRRYRR